MINNNDYNNFVAIVFRYATNNYRGHPRGLIIYGPATSASFSSNATSALSEVATRTVNNSSKLETISVKTSGIPAVEIAASLIQNASAPNITDTSSQQRCPLIPPNLGKQLARTEVGQVL